MAEVSVRELRNQGGQVLDRVLAGEHVVITRDGQAVAELRQLPRAAVGAQHLLERWRHVPRLDHSALRSDIDALLDGEL